jgi:hypothetical protein
METPQTGFTGDFLQRQGRIEVGRDEFVNVTQAPLRWIERLRLCQPCVPDQDMGDEKSLAASA